MSTVERGTVRVVLFGWLCEGEGDEYGRRGKGSIDLFIGGRGVDMVEEGSLLLRGVSCMQFEIFISMRTDPAD